MSGIVTITIIMLFMKNLEIKNYYKSLKEV